MLRLFEHLEIISASDATVLLEGETGVGKNRVARALHEMGPRASRPFVAFNASTLPHELFESELFGHVRGAFSGAYEHHKGLARAADGGTLFVDEVGELSPASQAKLLSFLDHKQVRPVGGLQSTQVDLRLIAATNHDLKALVGTGKFRRDLYYRIRVFPLRVPSLRERPEDVPLLAEHFVDEVSRKYGKRLAGISGAALERLRTWTWEGNVRELRNEMERAVILTPEGRRIEATALSFHDEAPAPSETGSPNPLRSSRRAAEKQVIVRALGDWRWNVSAAARELGISRVGLSRKLKRLGIRRPGTGTGD
jgi:transcriptional regulator with GAF, ATPase, and Fis domain